MRRYWIIGLSILVSGCGSAAAAEPDSRNPAHCYAALNFGNYWIRKGANDASKVAEGEARMLFEMKKSRSSGRSGDDFLAEGQALTKAYGNDQNRMNALLLDCLQAEQSDPEFQRQYPGLLALALAHPSAP